MNINCPACNGQTKVLDKRQVTGGSRRRIECVKCERRFTTLEQIVIENKGKGYFSAIVEAEIEARATALASRHLVEAAQNLITASVVVLRPDSDSLK